MSDAKYRECKQPLRGLVDADCRLLHADDREQLDQPSAEREPAVLVAPLQTSDEEDVVKEHHAPAAAMHALPSSAKQFMQQHLATAITKMLRL
jgi:hypothetical protein